MHYTRTPEDNARLDRYRAMILAKEEAEIRERDEDLKQEQALLERTRQAETAQMKKSMEEMGLLKLDANLMISQDDAEQLKKDNARLKEIADLFKKYDQKYPPVKGIQSAPNDTDGPREPLYVDEYPLPKNAKWETDEKFSERNGQGANTLYLVEGESKEEYDADGFPLKPATPDKPKIIKSPPRYEKAGEWQRRRWESLGLLPDSPDQMYLIEDK